MFVLSHFLWSIAVKADIWTKVVVHVVVCNLISLKMTEILWSQEIDVLLSLTIVCPFTYFVYYVVCSVQVS